MKRFVFIITTILALLLLLYTSVTTQSLASNTSHLYEYYYNDENTAKEALGVTNHTSQQSDKYTSLNSKLTASIDREPSSITVLINKECSLPADYIPNDLVIPDILYDFSYYDEKKLLRQEAADALEELFNSASDAGLTLYGISGYRSYHRQNEIYTNNLRTKGAAHTNQYSARPGFSEHQTGLSIDVSTASIGNRLEEVFEGTPEGIWLAKNAYKFGFIIRYPKDKSHITGYAYEPWHIRYVGKELAKYLTDHCLTLEEYYNFKPSEETTENISYDNILDYDGMPTPTKSPEPTTTSLPEDEGENEGENEVEEDLDSSEAPSPKPTKKPTTSPKPTKEPTPKPSHKPEGTTIPSPTPTPTIPPEVVEPVEPSLEPTQIPSNSKS